MTYYEDRYLEQFLQIQSRCVSLQRHLSVHCTKKAIRVSRLKQQMIFKTTAGVQLLAAEWVIAEVQRRIGIHY